MKKILKMQACEERCTCNNGSAESRESSTVNITDGEINSGNGGMLVRVPLKIFFYNFSPHNLKL